MKIYQICAYLLILTICCRAMPATSAPLEETTTSDPPNPKEAEKLSMVTDTPKKNKNTTTESRAFPDLEPVTSPFHGDEFKVKVLDLNHPTNQKGSLHSEISIGLASYHLQSPLVIKVPYYININDADLVRNPFYSTSDVTGSFLPFQEVPSLTQDFFSGVFGISDSYPVYPIELAQGVEHYPITSGTVQYPISGGAGEISTIPILGEVSQGIEFLQPDEINTEKVNHEDDSITVDASKKLHSTFEDFKQTTKKNEEAKKQKQN